MKDEETEVNLEEIVQVAPLIKPDKIEKVVKDTIFPDQHLKFYSLVYPMSPHP